MALSTEIAAGVDNAHGGDARWRNTHGWFKSKEVGLPMGKAGPYTPLRDRRPCAYLKEARERHQAIAKRPMFYEAPRSSSA